MKNRTIPYGYTYAEGRIILHPQESEIVKEVCRDYLLGQSMLMIAQGLNERMIEYMPAVYGWNKARIKRIIEDKRYLGDGKYPAIIDWETHTKMCALKDEKNTQAGVDRKTSIFKLQVDIICPHCKNKMHRRCDNVYTHKERWTCTNASCKTMIVKADADLLDDINGLLNGVVEKPDRIEIPTKTEFSPSLQLERINDEISRQFNAVCVDKQNIRNRMMNYVALKYAELDAMRCKAKKLKDIFLTAKTTDEFSMELFDRTVARINLYVRGEVGIVLKNNQEIRRTV
jgi:hypothetical protein